MAKHALAGIWSSRKLFIGPNGLPQDAGDGYFHLDLEDNGNVGPKGCKKKKNKKPDDPNDPGVDVEVTLKSNGSIHMIQIKHKSVTHYDGILAQSLGNAEKMVLVGLYDDNPNKSTPSQERSDRPVRLLGQEDGTWVGTKP